MRPALWLSLGLLLAALAALPGPASAALETCMAVECSPTYPVEQAAERVVASAEDHLARCEALECDPAYHLRPVTERLEGLDPATCRAVECSPFRPALRVVQCPDDEAPCLRQLVEEAQAAAAQATEPPMTCMALQCSPLWPVYALLHCEPPAGEVCLGDPAQPTPVPTPVPAGAEHAFVPVPDRVGLPCPATFTLCRMMEPVAEEWRDCAPSVWCEGAAGHTLATLNAVLANWDPPLLQTTALASNLVGGAISSQQEALAAASQFAASAPEEPAHAAHQAAGEAHRVLLAMLQEDEAALASYSSRLLHW